MRKPNRIQCRAFSLLELIAVCVVMGLISSIAVISVIGHLDQSELMRISQQLANADRKERDSSRQSPFPGGLEIENLKQRLQYICSSRAIDLGRNVKVAEFLVGSGTNANGRILFSQSGQSPTYAIRLESRRGALTWLVVVGMTGQILFTDNTDEVRSLLEMGS